MKQNRTTKLPLKHQTQQNVDSQIKANLAPITQQLAELTKLMQAFASKTAKQSCSTASSHDFALTKRTSQDQNQLHFTLLSAIQNLHRLV